MSEVPLQGSKAPQRGVSKSTAREEEAQAFRYTQVPTRDWYFIPEQQAPAPHLANLEGCAALRIVLVTVPRVSHSSLKPYTPHQVPGGG